MELAILILTAVMYAILAVAMILIGYSFSRATPTLPDILKEARDNINQTSYEKETQTRG